MRGIATLTTRPTSACDRPPPPPPPFLPFFFFFAFCAWMCPGARCQTGHRDHHVARLARSARPHARAWTQRQVIYPFAGLSGERCLHRRRMLLSLLLSTAARRAGRRCTARLRTSLPLFVVISSGAPRCLPLVGFFLGARFGTKQRRCLRGVAADRSLSWQPHPSSHPHATRRRRAHLLRWFLLLLLLDEGRRGL
eukprot:COSAG01_NODE_13356_length_1596_cov_4.219105_1_plen_194_part_10